MRRGFGGSRSFVAFRGGLGGGAGLLQQQVFKRIQPACPEVLVKTQPLLGAGQWAEDQPAQVGAAPHLALDQPGALQRLDVLGRGGQRDGKRFGQLAHRLLDASQAGSIPFRVEVDITSDGR